MAIGIATYRSDGSLSFEESDRLLQIVYSYTPIPNSSGSLVIPNITSISGIIPINMVFEAVTIGGQGFIVILQQPNIMIWQARPYRTPFLKPSNAKIILVSSNV